MMALTLMGPGGGGGGGGGGTTAGGPSLGKAGYRERVVGNGNRSGCGTGNRIGNGNGMGWIGMEWDRMEWGWN